MGPTSVSRGTAPRGTPGQARDHFLRSQSRREGTPSALLHTHVCICRHTCTLHAIADQKTRCCIVRGKTVECWVALLRRVSFEILDVLPSSRFTALCVGPVEGYSLEARDVELVCRQYSQFLQDDKVQLALK